jgi:methyltransferase (TIGR00027 family)
MKVDRASVTALATSLIRAVHTRCDTPTIMVDPYAERLVTDAERSVLLDQLARMLKPERQEEIRAITDRAQALDVTVRANPAYAAVLVRARYTEDLLAAAVGRGVRQYVLIGAGMDTFAFRRRELAGRLQVFEIDHPATQAMKRQRLNDAGLEPPSNLHFVAADLETESVAEALSRAPYTPSEPGFFAALGVTHYLTREANLDLLRAIGRYAAPGSEVVFDYLDRDAFTPDRASDDAKRLAAERAKSDEPWVSGFDPQRLAADLSSTGLALIEDLGAEAVQARYCAGRADGLCVTAHVHLAHARIAA